MRKTGKLPALRPFFLAAGILFGCTFMALSAFSNDMSLPYRSYPGFLCLHQNTRGECVDFVYDNSGFSGNNSQKTRQSATVTGDSLTMDTESLDGSTVTRGNIVEFRIHLSNDTGGRVRTHVRAFLDPYMTYSSSTDNGGQNVTRQIDWNNVTVPGDGENDLLLRVRISSSTPVGRRLTLRVETDDSNEEATLNVTASNSVTSTSTSNGRCSVVYYLVNGRRVTSTVRGDTCPDNTSAGSYNISISDSPDPFEPGELLTYTITIRNNDDISHTFTAEAFLDASTLYVSASDNPDRRGVDEVDWTDLSISSNGSRTLTLSVRTDRGLNDGDTVSLRVMANNDEATEESTAQFH